MTGRLTKRGNLDTDTHGRVGGWGGWCPLRPQSTKDPASPWRREGGGDRLSFPASEGTRPAHTLFLDLRPPELGVLSTHRGQGTANEHLSLPCGRLSLFTPSQGDSAGGEAPGGGWWGGGETWRKAAVSQHQHQAGPLGLGSLGPPGGRGLFNRLGMERQRFWLM